MTLHVTQRPCAFRVYTHNIRYATEAPFPGEVPWEKRKHLVISSIKFHARNNTFVCLQEVLHHQLQDLLKALGKEWAYIGVGRDGGDKGEFNPIFYKVNEWSVLKARSIWLSETPNRPSRGWDAANNRVLEYGHFRHVSGPDVHIYNTHLDDQGIRSRKESAKLILQKVKEHNTFPIALAGDFNSPEEEEAYQEVATELTDVYKVVDPLSRYGHYHTYTAFAGEAPSSRIDFIWTKGLQIDTYGVLHTHFHKMWASDHRPVAADLST